MTFTVVAASYRHRERQRSAPYRTVMAGVTFGGVAVFLGFVGILTMFGQREVIAETLSLAHLTIAMSAFFAGLWVTHASSRTGLGARVAQGLGAGAVAGALIALLALSIHLFKLRRVFIALKKDLLDILTFEQSIGAAVAILVIGGALCGLLGAALYLMPRKLRRPLVVGLTWAFFVGLFQELIQLMLQYEFLMKFRELFFTWDGLKPRGALIVFAAAAVTAAAWQAYRPRYDSFRENATPGQARMLLGFKILIGLVLIIGFPAFAGNFIGQVLMLVGLYVLMGMGPQPGAGARRAARSRLRRILRGRRVHHRVAHVERGHRDRQHELLAGAADRGGAVGGHRGAVRDPGAQGARGLSRGGHPGSGRDRAGAGALRFRRPGARRCARGAQHPAPEHRRLRVQRSGRPLLHHPRGPPRWPPTSRGAWRIRGSAAPGPPSATTRTWRRRWASTWSTSSCSPTGSAPASPGVAGAIFAVMLASIFPHSFQLLISINVLALLIVGGMGSLPGVVVGAAALIGLPELLREFGEYRFLFYGLVIVVMMRLKAEGLWPSAARRRERMLEEESRAAIEAELRGGGSR